MKMKLSRILTLIVALGLLGSAVETIPSSVQLVEVAAAQKKTAKKKKTKKSTSKSKKKPVKKTTSKSKKKPAKKTTSKSKKKTTKKTASKPKKKSVKKPASKSKKKTVKKTTSKPTTNTKTNQPSTKPSTDQPSTKPSTEQPANKPSTNQPSTKPSTEQPADKPSTDQPSTKQSTEQPADKPSTDQPADKPENSSSVKESKDADHYKPIAGEPDVGVAVGDPLPWSWLISNENELPSGTKLKFDKELDLNKVGTYYIKVIAQYPDGSENSSDTIQVRVRPKTDAEIYEPIVKDGEGFTGNDLKASELVTNADTLPKGTEFYFDSKVDCYETGVYSATITAYYPDGSKDVTRPVTVKIISPLDFVSIEASEAQSSPNSRYLMLKVTNKSDKTLNFRASMNVEDTHGKEISSMGGGEYGPVAPNQSIILYGNFWDEKPYYYGHINYQFYATDTDHKSANSDLKVEVVKNKGFGYDIKATNIGTKKIYYPSVDVFLFKDGKVIYEHETLMEPDDADGLQPGESITKSFQSDDYDDVESSYTSSYDK
ncbi:Rib/alpha-like domain-containing protein [Lactobacillus delbrueckii]|uniref:Rib/alpha-like domain-containing protein n=1 Tax=Lactobacillus delbrueckii TaxID=1584 RepID=UPI0023646348|nr:Rib/alpha-like domain-containing protein [Lactobacillus delbrueckii]MDD1332619.1 Rib/alpha-like domain-containing protein [Lactobacillus delbrueckii subsp. lactis]